MVFFFSFFVFFSNIKFIGEKEKGEEGRAGEKERGRRNEACWGHVGGNRNRE